MPRGSTQSHTRPKDAPEAKDDESKEARRAVACDTNAEVDDARTTKARRVARISTTRNDANGVISTRDACDAANSGRTTTDRPFARTQAAFAIADDTGSTRDASRNSHATRGGVRYVNGRIAGSSAIGATRRLYARSREILRVQLRRTQQLALSARSDRRRRSMERARPSEERADSSKWARTRRGLRVRKEVGEARRAVNLEEICGFLEAQIRSCRSTRPLYGTPHRLSTGTARGRRRRQRSILPFHG